MEIAFDTKTLRKLCENKAKAKNELGEEMAEKLVRRLADIRAATCVKDLIMGNPRVLNHRSDKYIIDICDGSGIIFTANHNTNPINKSGEIDWLKVWRIKILDIRSKNV